MPLDNVVDLRSLRRRPSTRRQAIIDAHRIAEQVHAQRDHVARAALEAEHAELLHVVREQLAVEVAGLAFERTHGNRSPEETAKLASRRIRGLAALAAATLEIHRAEAGSPPEPVVRHVTDLLRVEVEDCATEIFDRATADRFIDAIRRRLDAPLDNAISGR
jgi:hypothetical protein